MARQGLLRSLQLLKGVAQQQQQAASFAAAAGAKPRKVAVLGAAGGIGQPLSMLMKVSASVKARVACVKRGRTRVSRSKVFPDRGGLFLSTARSGAREARRTRARRAPGG